MERNMENTMETGLCSTVVTYMEQELQKWGGSLGGTIRNR